MASSSIAVSGSPHLVPIHQSKSMVTLKPPVLTCLPLTQTPVTVSCRDIAGAAAENSSVLMASQNIFASNGHGAYRFPQLTSNSGPVGTPQHSSSLFASSVFPLKNRTNTQGSPNFLLQTILKDSRQVKAEYEAYKTITESKLRKQQDEIGNLKEKVGRYQKKVLEMKLQKEVYVARESHAFKEIQDGIHHLLQKVTEFAQAESLNVGTSHAEAQSVSSQGSGSHKSESEGQKGYSLNSNEEFGRRLESLERKMASIESNGEEVLSKYMFTEENLKSYMASVNDKLDQIMLYVMENREMNIPQVHIEADADISSYNASAEDNQEDSDAGESTVVLGDNSVPRTKPGVESESNVYEVPTAPVQIVLKSTGRSASEVRLKHRKRKSICGVKSLRKRSLPKRRRGEPTLQCHSCVEFNGGDNREDYEEPPVLTLPCRIAKDSGRRPQSMPILLPEGVRPEEDISERKEQVNEEILVQENRKDDALIGIKRENFSTGMHGRDFSKLGFFCLCGAKFTGAGGLYVHQVKTMENEKFTCTYPECGKRYHYYSSLKAHKKHSHKQEFTQEVGCSRCGQIFKSKKDRQGHRDERGQTCWLSGSYQSKDWDAIRNKRNLSTTSYYTSSSTSSSQNAGSENSVCSI